MSTRSPYPPANVGPTSSARCARNDRAGLVPALRTAALAPGLFALFLLLSGPRGAPALAAQQLPPLPSLLQDLRWRNIGPANMAGRISHIEAVESNPAVVFMAAASGGVWKSTNAGTTWEQIFGHYGSSNIGALAVFQPNPDIVWVGTGEGNVRNSVGWGDGIYKSTDGGRTFVNMGLGDSQIIDEIVLHPTNPDVVYVAAQGHLWGYNAERGVFRSRDGGRSWTRLAGGLPNNDSTGANALVMDPTNPDVLYAGMSERIRRPDIFESGGSHGGIYKTTDGGDRWQRLTNGLPPGRTGKIGLAIYRRDPRILVALVEHPFQPQPSSPDYGDLSKLGSGTYRSEDGGATWRYVSRANPRPMYFSHIWIDPNDAQRVYLLAGSAMVSEDGGRTFPRVLDESLGPDFHSLWIDPSNSNRFYIGADHGAFVTYDRGEHALLFDNMDVGQFYAVTVDNRDPYHVYGGLQDNGNWVGPSNSRDASGIFVDHWSKFHAGDGFHTTVDPNDWRTVYTERQNGGIARFDAVFRQVGKAIKPTPSTILNHDAVAAANGGAPTFRYNWSAPLILSPHDSKVVYFGGNHLFRSTDRGDTWRIVSPDLSTGQRVRTRASLPAGWMGELSGAEGQSALITVSESPLVPGVIWAGTDDGNVQVTRNGGTTWTDVTANIGGVPQRLWVSRVEASHFDPGTAYVSFDGHRSDDFRPFVFKTTDFGRTWASLAAGLPVDEPVYVVKEDLRNPSLLFVGTEFSALVSTDGGRGWTRLMEGLPTVPVHDLVIHPRDGDLIAATHGRSIWILDDITPLQQLTPEVLAADVHVFRNRVATRWRAITRGGTRGHMFFVGRNPLTVSQEPPQNSPVELANTAAVSFYLRNAPTGPVEIEITSLDASQQFKARVAAKQGINRYYWDLHFDPSPAASSSAGDGQADSGPQVRGPPRGPEAGPGTYRVRLTVGDRSHEGAVTVRDDPDVVGVL